MNDSPTILTREDIDKAIEKLMNFELKKRPCWSCAKEFYANYSREECDECFFAKFPKDEREAFYRSFFE